MTPPATRSPLPALPKGHLVKPRFCSPLRKRSFLPAESASLATRHSSLVTGRRPAAFTLIELLVVIAIIAILAGLGFAGISGALKSAKKAETRAMANQIKLAISSYYAEYGTYPAVTTANTGFLNAMTGSTNVGGIPNRRGIRFLEISPKFTNAQGIVTPQGLYKSRTDQRVFSIRTDTNYDGQIDLGFTNLPGSVAVWVDDPDGNNKQLGTW